MYLSGSERWAQGSAPPLVQEFDAARNFREAVKDRRCQWFARFGKLTGLIDSGKPA